MRNKEILRLVLITLSLIVQLTTKGQNNNENTGGKITGKIIDSLSKQPVEYATITLSAVGSNQVLNGTTADSTGSFKLPGIAPGTYIVAVDFIGYKTHTIRNLVLNKKSDVLNLKTILLSKSDGMLQGVVVSSQQKLIDNRIDKLVFNAEKDLTSQSGVATDVLKKVPQVSVDPDGNVELAGSGGITLFNQWQAILCFWQQRNRCVAIYTCQPDKKY